jgi:hypothetical protein
MYKNDKKIHYNLWLELKKEQRFSAMFRKEKNTPDNILLPHSLFDNKNISYIDDSFKVFKPPYLYQNKKLNRWKRYKGYSDHLPILATFTTDQIKQKKTIKDKKTINNTIKYLYEIEHLTKPLNLQSVVVIYKNKDSAILKKNDRSIYAYKCAKNLKVGNSYNLTIDSIDSYNGLLEVKSIRNISKVAEKINHKKLYKDGTKIDIFDTNYTNEIVTNLKGIYKKRYLHLKNGKKIRVYFKKNIKTPKENTNITIQSGHLTIYKGQVQITIHKKSDIIQYD